MSTELANLRKDVYTLGTFNFTAETLEYDYKELDYETLRKIYIGDPSTGLQLGGLFAPIIVDLWTAFEIGNLPKVVVGEIAAKGKINDDFSNFLDRFLHEQHNYLMEIVSGKNMQGNNYAAFNLDRNLESMVPDSVDPGFAFYTDGLISAKVVTNRFFRDPKDGEKVKATITRNYDADKIVYDTKFDKNISGVKIPKKLTIPNPIGVCPVVQIPNIRIPGFQFSLSDFFLAIPYFKLFHWTLLKGFEAQQYSGKPILQIKGISGDVRSWFQRTFGVDVENDGDDAINSKLMAFFRRHKILALADNVEGSFIESKMPIGKTEEILSIAFSQIARLSGIPEFMFGGAMESANATVREQYTGLLARVNYKRTVFERALRQLCRMALVYYSVWSKNEETGMPLETYGLVSTYEETLRFSIDFIWPNVLGSDERVKIETLAMMAQAGSISKKGMMLQFPELIPNPDAELKQIEDEMKQFGPLQAPNETISQGDAKDRATSSKSNQDGNQDANQRK